MSTLHVGINPLDLHQALRAVYPTMPDIEGDGWECWGEDIGTDVNDDYTLHVAFTVTKTKEARAIVKTLREIDALTTTTGSERFGGMEAVLTSTAEYSEAEVLWFSGEKKGRRVGCSVCSTHLNKTALDIDAHHAESKCLMCRFDEHEATHES